MFSESLKQAKIGEHIIKFAEGTLSVTENIRGKSWGVSLSGVEDISTLLSIFNEENSFSCELLSKENIVYYGNAIISHISLNNVKISGDGPLKIKQ